MDKQKKPRLAEVLGVEEDEEWTFPGRKETYRVHNGILESKFESKGIPGWPWTKYSFETVCNIINHPESIIRVPRLTDNEMVLCRASKAKYLARDKNSYQVILYEEKPVEVANGRYGNARCLGSLTYRLFPSVGPGRCICVEEAISGD